MYFNKSSLFDAKATLQIAHHLETLGQHVETIAQLRREVTQWKDTSKNWQDHFARVEGERVALASRIDELQAERLLLTKNALTQAQNSLVSTPHSAYLTDSPTQASTSKQEAQSAPHHTHTNGTNSRRGSGALAPKSEPPKRVKPTSSVPIDSPLHASSSKTSQHAAGLQRIPQPHLTQQAQQEASERRRDDRRKRKEEERQKELAAQQPQQQPTPKSQSQPAGRQTTVLRRVQAVIHVKQEEGSDEEPPLPETPPPPGERSRGRSRTGQQQELPQTEPKPRRRRTSRIIVQDDDYDDDESEEDAAVARNLRASRAIDYAESEVDGESEEDELMIGNEVRSTTLQRSRRGMLKKGGWPCRKIGTKCSARLLGLKGGQNRVPQTLVLLRRNAKYLPDLSGDLSSFFRSACSQHYPSHSSPGPCK